MEKKWFNIELPAKTDEEKARIEKFKRYLKTSETYYESSSVQGGYLHFEILTATPAAVNDALDRMVWGDE